MFCNPSELRFPAVQVFIESDSDFKFGSLPSLQSESEGAFNAECDSKCDEKENHDETSCYVRPHGSAARPSI